MFVDCSVFACVVCSCVYLLVTVRVSACVRACVRAWLPTRARRHFALLSCTPETSELRAWYSDVALFQICFFLCRSIEHTHAHTRARVGVHQQHGQLALLNTRTRSY